MGNFIYFFLPEPVGVERGGGGGEQTARGGRGWDQKYSSALCSNGTAVLMCQGNCFFPVNDEKEKEEEEVDKEEREVVEDELEEIKATINLSQQCSSRVVVMPKEIVSFQ